MSTVDLKALRDKLPLGYADTVADRLKGEFTPSYIRLVVAGTRWNKDIADEVVKLAEEHQQELASMQARVDALVTPPETEKSVNA